MRVLCTADVHIGRSSSGDIEMPGGAGDVSALAAWERIVREAVDGKADVVVIAGDLFDSIEALNPARARVRQGFEQLRGNGIRAIAVAGNHDYRALVHFNEMHPGLVRVFGSAGWETETVGDVRFVGRSFSGEFESESLLTNFDIPAGDKLTIGLVHADINVQSRYGATSLESFAGRGVAAWVVGHVHAPRIWENPLVTYPGSPQALDWGETGAHGFRWLITEAGRARFSDVISLSSVRYEEQELDLRSGDNLESNLADISRSYKADAPGLRSVQFRVHVRLKELANPVLPDDATVLNADGYFIRSKLPVHEIDLEEQATQRDARGQAARLLLGLRGLGEAAWQSQANALVAQINISIEKQRGGLKLVGEDFNSLRQGNPGESHNATERALLRVLSAGRATP